MTRPALNAPWRMEYIKSLGKEKKDDRCFLCEAAAVDPAANPALAAQRLVLWQTEFCTVLINRYPYANGHLLVAPRAHKADITDLTPAEAGDLMIQTAKATRLLRAAVSAQGFNVGINLGRVAGAGVPGHLHQHIVPRWGGDINFMHAIGQVSIVPETNAQLYVELARLVAADQHNTQSLKSPTST